MSIHDNKSQTNKDISDVERAGQPADHTSIDEVGYKGPQPKEADIDYEPIQDGPDLSSWGRYLGGSPFVGNEKAGEAGETGPHPDTPGIPESFWREHPNYPFETPGSARPSTTMKAESRETDQEDKDQEEHEEVYPEFFRNTKNPEQSIGGYSLFDSDEHVVRNDGNGNQLVYSIDESGRESDEPIGIVDEVPYLYDKSRKRLIVHPSARYADMGGFLRDYAEEINKARREKSKKKKKKLHIAPQQPEDSSSVETAEKTTELETLENIVDNNIDSADNAENVNNEEDIDTIEEENEEQTSQKTSNIGIGEVDLTDVNDTYVIATENGASALDAVEKNAADFVDGATGTVLNEEDNENKEAEEQEKEDEAKGKPVYGDLGNANINEKRQEIDDYIESEARRAFIESTELNESIYSLFKQQKEVTPDLTLEEFLKEHPLSEGDFHNLRKKDEDSVLKEAEESLSSEYLKSVSDLFKFFDFVFHQIRKGHIHIQGEYIENDELKWRDERIQTKIDQVMQTFNGQGNAGVRTVMRMAMLYCSLRIDERGRILGKARNNYTMSADEFVEICNEMLLSIQKYGHPFVSSFRLHDNASMRSLIGGRETFCAGVIPMIVAKEITGPQGCCFFKTGPFAGQYMTAKDLIEMCRQEWNNYTHPVAIKILTTQNADRLNKVIEKSKKKKKGERDEDGKSIEQKVEEEKRDYLQELLVLERYNQGLSRLDGMTDQDFSGLYHIDVAQHFKLQEYEEQEFLYAAAANNLYDSDKVFQRRQEELAEYKDSMQSYRNSHEIGTLEAAILALTSGVKTNAIFWLVPIRLSMIAEKGVGSLQTWLTLKSLQKWFGKNEEFEISKELLDAFYTESGFSALEAAYIILEMGGPNALRLFSSTGEEATVENAMRFIQQSILRQAANEQAARLQEMQMKWDRISKKLMSGDHYFRKADAQNFLLALMTASLATAKAQETSAAQVIQGPEMEMDSYADQAFTGAELDDALRAHGNNVAAFMTELMNYNVCKDALQMMKANNISNFNAVGFGIESLFRKNKVGTGLSAAVTLFLDTFPTYGINFIYTMLPLSRTFTYLALKIGEDDIARSPEMKLNGRDIANLAIAGNLGTMQQSGNITTRNGKFDTGFWNGLMMNLMFDIISMGKWVLGAALIGFTLFVLGLRPPDDPENMGNFSMWKIGHNFGWGPQGQGIEINYAYWLNDLTQWGLPLGYWLGAYMTLDDDWKQTITGTDANTIEEAEDPEANLDKFDFEYDKWDVLGQIYVDCLSDQFDGNVALDIVDCIGNWGVDRADIEATLSNPDHEMTRSPMYGISEFCMELGLKGFSKIVPVAPLYKAWGRSAFLRGPEAEAFTTNKVYDKSSDWAIQIEKTDYIEDEKERLIRKYSAGNWLLALAMDLNQLAEGKRPTGTGYFWHEMPTASKTEPFALVLAEEQKIDYDHGLMEGETLEEYQARRTSDLISMIDELGYTNPYEAARDGFFITTPMREAALHTVFAEINVLENEWDAICDAHVYTGSAFYDHKDLYEKRKSDLWNFINDWLKNDDLPSWTEQYKQILSDYDITYLNADGSVANKFLYQYDKIFNGGRGVKAVYHLKGNHPTGMLPLTPVVYEDTEKVDRGPSGQTVPYWLSEQSDLTPRSILTKYADSIIPVGRDKGKTVADVYYGEENGDTRWHDGIGNETIGDRAWFHKIEPLPDEIKNFGKEDTNGGIYGKLGQSGSSDSKSSGSTSEGSDSKTSAQKATERANQIAANDLNVDSKKLMSSSGSAVSSILGTFGAGSAVVKKPHEERESFLDAVISGLKGVTNGKSGKTNGKSAKANGKSNPGTSGIFDDVDYIIYDDNGNLIDFSNNKSSNQSGGVYKGGKSYYPRYTYRSSGYSSNYNYNPKIYSNPHNVYSSNPSTMYTKQPYSTHNNSYLRPSYSTKGSREAYRRQDF